MESIDYVINFIADMGKEMLLTGASLERTTDTMFRIAAAYELYEPNIYAMSTTLIVSAKDQNGEQHSYHLQLPPCGTHMARLNSLNKLSRKICEEKPEPSDLHNLLVNFEKTEDYPDWMIIFGDCLALASICRIFKGSIWEILCVIISTIIMYYLIKILGEQGVNRIIKDTICMFAAGCMAFLYVRIGIGKDFYTIVLTNAFMMIPGIQMVNAVRNILCGNEANGVIELMKVVLETVAIVLGIVISILLFGGAML